MTLDDFLKNHFLLAGGDFTLANVLGLPAADTVWGQYLTGDTLSLTGARLSAPDDLTVTGSLSLPGSPEPLPATVVFSVADGQISGARITAESSALRVITTYASLSLTNYPGIEFKTAGIRLIAEAGADAQALVGFTVEANQVGGKIPVAFWSPYGLDIPQSLPMMEPYQLLFEAEIPDSGSIDLVNADALRFLAPNMNFIDSFPSVVGPSQGGVQLLAMILVAWGSPGGRGSIDVLSLFATIRLFKEFPIIPRHFTLHFLDAEISVLDPTGSLMPSLSTSPGITLVGGFDFGDFSARAPQGRQPSPPGAEAIMMVEWDPSLMASMEGSLNASTPVIFTFDIFDPVDLQSLLSHYLRIDSLGPLKGLSVNGIFAQGNVANSSFTLSVGLTGTLTLLDAIEITDVTLSLGYDGSGGVTGGLFANFELGGVGLYFSAQHDGEWVFSGGVASDSTVIHPELFFESLKQTFPNIRVPKDVSALSITELLFTGSLGAADGSGEGFDFLFKGQTDFCGNTAPFAVTASADKSPGGEWSFDFAGTLSLQDSAGSEQLLTVDYHDDYFTGQWACPPNKTLTAKDIGAWFGVTLPAGFPGPGIRALAFTHTPVGVGASVEMLVFKGAIARMSQAPSDGSPKPCLFALEMTPGLVYSATPFAPKSLPSGENFGIPTLQSIYSNVPLGAATPITLETLLNLLPPDLEMTIPLVELPGGEALLPLMLPSALSDGQIVLAPGSSDFRMGARPEQAGSSQPTLLWIPVDRSFGPVLIGRLGIGYASGAEGGLISLGVDAGFSIGGFSAEFIGLTLSHDLKEDLDFRLGLDGISIAYEDGAIDFAGEFVKAADSAGDTDYAGMASLGAAGFELSVMGAYSKNAQTEESSLFVFGLLDDPIGGPPWCFVTGLAGAIGINRSLSIPSLSDLPTFPLVAAAIADDTHPNPFGPAPTPGSALAVMEPCIPPDYGNKWFGMGARFSTFGILESFALLTASFGKKTQFALLGLTAMTLPKGSPTPIAYAELALEALCDPDEGVLTVSGQLTPQSYVISPSCQLQGGFAFSAWFKDQGAGNASAGEFALSLGGYHPLFSPPHYYPVPARVTAQWPVNDCLNIDGSFYFALTPGALMAGGSLNAVWESSGVRAWFSENADFLLGWRPFRYAADIDLSLGVSYTLDLLFTSVTVSVSLGVTVHLAGPSLHGYIDVDLYVISFKISFKDGEDGESEISVISWSDFKQSLLPSGITAPGVSDASVDGEDPPAPIQTSAMCRARVTSGLVKDLTGNRPQGAPRDPQTPDWIISSDDFSISTESVFVSTSMALGAQEIPPSWNVEIDAGPAGIARSDAHGNITFSTRQEITLTRTDCDPADTDYSACLLLTPILQSVPRATWSCSAAQASSVADLNTHGTSIANALVGARLTPNRKAPDALPAPIALDLLKAAATEDQSFAWSDFAAAAPMDQSQAQEQFNAMGSVALRAKIALLAAKGGANVAPPGDLSELGANDYLAQTPLISATGGL